MWLMSESKSVVHESDYASHVFFFMHPVKMKWKTLIQRQYSQHIILLYIVQKTLM